MRKRPPKAKRFPWRSMFVFFLVIFAVTFFLSASFAPLARLATAPPAQNQAGTLEKLTQNYPRVYQIFAIKKAVAAKLNKKNYVKSADISPELKNAVVAMEDNRFYTHYGFDPVGIIRAALVNLQKGSFVEGGSTITQQLAKNLFLSREKSYFRKAEELILAIDLEQNFSKDEILEIYLNTIYFGAGAYGVAEASSLYFAKLPVALSLAESALLAGVVNAPSVNSPLVNLPAAKERQRLVLEAMVKHGYISLADAKEARDAPVKLR